MKDLIKIASKKPELYEQGPQNMWDEPVSYTHLPKDHPLSEKVAVSLSDINNEDFVLSSDGLDYETGKIFELNNIKPRIRYRLNEDFATLKMVEKGFGVTILPRLLLYNAPFDVCIRSFTEHYSRVLGVAYSKDAPPSLAILKFLDYVKDWSHELD